MLKNNILLFVIFIVSLLFFGCISRSYYLQSTGYCSKVKDAISSDFGFYGLILKETEPGISYSYCEYYSGNILVLKVLYNEEPDPERAFFTYVNSITSNSILEGFHVFDYKKSYGSAISSFFLELANSKTGEIKSYAVTFDYSASVTLSSSYYPGYPNPFIEGNLLERIAKKALAISKA